MGLDLKAAPRLRVSSGTTATDSSGRVVHPGNPSAQTRLAIRNIAAALRSAGSGLEDVVQTRLYVTDISRWKEVARAHGQALGPVRPATAMVEVSRLIDPKMLVEIEAVARAPRPARDGNHVRAEIRLRKARPADLAFIRRKAEEWRRTRGDPGSVSGESSPMPPAGSSARSGWRRNGGGAEWAGGSLTSWWPGFPPRRFGSRRT